MLGHTCIGREGREGEREGEGDGGREGWWEENVDSCNCVMSIQQRRAPYILVADGSRPHVVGSVSQYWGTASSPLHCESSPSEHTL